MSPFLERIHDARYLAIRAGTSTANGLAILGFYATLGYTNLVRIDALPPCQ